MKKKLSKQQKTVITISGIFIAMAAFVGLMMALSIAFYFLNRLF